MHEYGIAFDIYATAQKVATDNRATAVKCVHVEMGALAMVNPEQVIFLFTVIAADDPRFADARLSCEQVAARGRCGCGYVGEEAFVCPQCGGMPELIRGREILVTSVEIEVPD